jgi:hypothetical protein
MSEAKLTQPTEGTTYWQNLPGLSTQRRPLTREQKVSPSWFYLHESTDNFEYRFFHFASDILIKNNVITYKRKKKNSCAFPFFVCVVANIYIFAVCVFFWTSSHLWFKYSCVIYMFFLPYLTTNKGDTLDKGLYFFLWLEWGSYVWCLQWNVNLCVYSHLGQKKGNEFLKKQDWFVTREK